MTPYRVWSRRPNGTARGSTRAPGSAGLLYLEARGVYTGVNTASRRRDDARFDQETGRAVDHGDRRGSRSSDGEAPAAEARPPDAAGRGVTPGRGGRRLHSGEYVPPTKILVEEFLERWLRDYAEPRVGPVTLHGYRDAIRKKIIPALGLIPLRHLHSGRSRLPTPPSWLADNRPLPFVRRTMPYAPPSGGP